MQESLIQHLEKVFVRLKGNNLRVDIVNVIFTNILLIIWGIILFTKMDYRKIRRM